MNTPDQNPKPAGWADSSGPVQTSEGRAPQVPLICPHPAPLPELILAEANRIAAGKIVRDAIALIRLFRRSGTFVSIVQIMEAVRFHPVRQLVNLGWIERVPNAALWSYVPTGPLAAELLGRADDGTTGQLYNTTNNLQVCQKISL